MNLSATQLGSRLGLSGEETNQLLFNKGILSGTPGDYDLTELGKNYATSRSHHRGPGGYSQYNKYWVTRLFNESILEDLDINEEAIKLAKDQVATRRKERFVLQAAERAKANKEFLAKEAAKKAAEMAEKKKLQDTAQLIDNLKKAGKIGVVIVGISLASYGIYKVITYTKNINDEGETKELEDKDVTTQLKE